MSALRWKRWLLISFGIILALTVAWEVHAYLQIRQQLLAKETETRMSQLMGVLDAERPQLLDPEHLRPLLTKYNRQECLEDGWGRLFVIENGAKERRDGYTIISLGRDGHRGHCCQALVANWDDDAVLSGSHWLQVWDSKAAQAAER